MAKKTRPRSGLIVRTGLKIALMSTIPFM
jgi:hypothetical protein